MWFTLGYGTNVHKNVCPKTNVWYNGRSDAIDVINIFKSRYAFGYVATSFFGLFLETPEDAVYEDVDRNFLKIYFTVPSIFSLLRIIILLTCIRFDPPFYYITQSDEQNALVVIDKIYKTEYREEILDNYRR